MSMAIGSHMTNIRSTPNVRHARHDLPSEVPYIGVVIKRPRKPRLGDYERYRAASGWWLAAWRDFKGLTLEDVAAEVGTSKGIISDLETGALRSTGNRAQRYNADTLRAVASALKIHEGWLLDINPFDADPHWLAVADGFRDLDDNAKAAVAGLVDQLRPRQAN